MVRSTPTPTPTRMALLKDGPLHGKRVPVAPEQQVYLAASPGQPGVWFTYMIYGMADGRVLGVPGGIIVKQTTSRWTKEAQGQTPSPEQVARSKHMRQMDADGGKLLYFCIAPGRGSSVDYHTYYTVEGVLHD